MTKTCKVCGVTSDAAEFYSSMTNRCKDCHKKKMKENREENADYYRAYDAARFKNDPKVAERHKRYQATEQGKGSLLKAKLKYISQKPEARAAHVILGNAVRDGRVYKQLICKACGAHPKRRNMHAHHEDYAKPLDVVWLCSTCHATHHRET